MASPSPPLLHLLLLLLLLGCFSCSLVSAQTSSSSSNDNGLFATFYNSVVDMVVPSYDPTSSAPRQVVLFEMPGVVINRQEWDADFWAANNFPGRQPDAVAASFVDRLPYYYGPTFVDSGVTISGFWSTFLSQYVIPTIQDPSQVAKADAAKAALANGTLVATFQTRLDEYDAAAAAFENQRTDCLSKAAPAACSRRMVIWNERLRRKWFSLEVARRDVASAEALVLALQVQDLKNLFADALEKLGSSERIDIGASGFGQEYYLTYLTPSNFWRWWPQNVGTSDYSVSGSGAPLNFTYTRPGGASVLYPPRYGQLTYDNNTGIAIYTPDGVATAIDRVGFAYVPAGGGARQVDYKTINVVGSEVLLANTAFTAVSVSTSSSASSASSSSTYAKTFETSSSSASSSVNVGWWWWRYSGSSTSSTSSTSSSSAATSSTAFTSSSTSSSFAFELARVTITRPWLDMSLLNYKPVAVRGVIRNGWSDGLSTPAKNSQYQFKLLPVAFLVARNVLVKNSSWGSKTSTLSDISSTSRATTTNSNQVSIGPFFIGSGSGSSQSSSRDYRERSSFTSDSSSTSGGGTLSIQGPQIIGWVCTPVPAFPNASEDDVRLFEEAQLQKFYKQLAANQGVPLANLTGTTTQLPTPRTGTS